LVTIRRGIEYAIYATIRHKLSRRRDRLHPRLLKRLFASSEPQVVSLNYDLLIDEAIVAFGSNESAGHLPDYACSIHRNDGEKGRTHGRLLKLHGSLNWLYCPGCQQLQLTVSDDGARTVPVTDAAYDMWSLRKSRCKLQGCGSVLTPLLITPSHLKDYRNPHVSRVWFEALQTLRRASHVVFIGYSLPHDDVEVIYLLKRGLRHLTPEKITVVEFDESGRSVSDNPVGRRYRAVFGTGIDWHTGGFKKWLDNAVWPAPLSEPKPKQAAAKKKTGGAGKKRAKATGDAGKKAKAASRPKQARKPATSRKKKSAKK
jgi:hypothetical protein